jgi:hypothetical protein
MPLVPIPSQSNPIHFKINFNILRLRLRIYIPMQFAVSSSQEYNVQLYELGHNVLSREGVTIDGVWIGHWIY